MEESVKSQRNNNFDGFKGIACIAVVFMHCEFPGTTGVIIQCLSRWAVPLFFAISGFFFRKEEVSYCLNKAKHIGMIALYSSIFYVIYEIIFHIWTGDFISYVSVELTAVNFLAFVLFNSPMFINGHLWFLFALIYVYLLCALLIKFNLLQYRNIMCVILLCMHFAIAYGGYVLGYSIPGGVYRNFILEGFPCFLIGNIVYLWSCEQEKKREDAYVWYGIFFICIGLIISLIERNILGRDFSIHIASVVVLIGILLVSIKKGKSFLAKSMIELGRKYSMLIYILHPAVYMVSDVVFKDQLDSNQIYAWLRPINTVLLTIAVSIVFKCIKDIIKGGEVY